MSHRPGMRAAAVAALLLLAAAARPAAATTQTCQKSIQKTGAKLEKLLVKDLQKCVDLYRKAITAGKSVTDVADDCNTQLAKAIAYPDPTNASALQQAKNALAAMGGVSCMDDDLIRLGHLPEGTFGDRWQRWLLVARLAGAYQKLVDLVGDAPAALSSMAAAGGCPLCAKIKSSPCTRVSCGLGPGSGAKAYAPAQFSIALTGEETVQLCRYDDVLPNEYAVVGAAAKTIARSQILTTSLCTRIVGTEGIVACSGSSAPKVSYTACQDHLVNAPDVDECAGSGVLCQDSSTDPIPEHAGSVNGGACVGFSTAAPATGAAFALARVEITLVASTQKGPDGVACTDDDTAGPPIALDVPLTTATATGFLFDAVASQGNTISPAAVTGAAFSCPALPAGNLAGGQLVGAATALHALCLTPPCDDPTTPADEGAVPIDAVITFNLVCQ